MIGIIPFQTDNEMLFEQFVYTHESILSYLFIVFDYVLTLFFKSYALDVQHICTLGYANTIV